MVAEQSTVAARITFQTSKSPLGLTALVVVPVDG
jgi:hypothetical protein